MVWEQNVHIIVMVANVVEGGVVSGNACVCVWGGECVYVCVCECVHVCMCACLCVCEKSLVCWRVISWAWPYFTVLSQSKMGTQKY